MTALRCGNIEIYSEEIPQKVLSKTLCGIPFYCSCGGVQSAGGTGGLGLPHQ